MTSVCPLTKAVRPDDACPRKSEENHDRYLTKHGSKVKEESDDSTIISPECPLGYDSHTFKLGPLSCMICQALLFESSKWFPCSHKYCNRAMGNAASAITYFKESADFLSKLPMDDLEVTHTLSVSLNKIGDLKYYDGDLPGARSYYSRSLDVRRSAIKDRSDVPSQTLDVAVSLAKVADVDRNHGNEDSAIDGYEEAIKCLKSLTLDSNQSALEPRRLSVLEFIQNQLADNNPTSSV